MSIFSKITNFFKGVWLEMRKINWPTRGETFRNTLIVIGVCVVVAIFLGGFDYIFIHYILPWITSI